MSTTIDRSYNMHGGIMTPHRLIAWEYGFRDETDPEDKGGSYAIANMDGSWWIDWDRLQRCAAHLAKTPLDVNTTAVLIPLRLLLLARGRLTEVSRERADEIALEYGARASCT